MDFLLLLVIIETELTSKLLLGLLAFSYCCEEFVDDILKVCLTIRNWKFEFLSNSVFLVSFGGVIGSS